MRAWIELPAGSGWGEIRVASQTLRELGYTVEELRGARNVLLRMSGARLEVSELWRVPGQG